MSRLSAVGIFVLQGGEDVKEHGSSTRDRLIEHCGSRHEVIIALGELVASGAIRGDRLKGSLQFEYWLVYGGAA